MRWLVVLGAAIAAGLASRAIHLGWVLWDKYLGDALYAVMIYALLSLGWRTAAWRRALTALSIMVMIECFQLTGIPAQEPVLGRLLGTTFGFGDLGAYAAGIFGVWLGERWTGYRLNV